MYGGGGYGSSGADARQPLNPGGASTNYRGMNLDTDEDRHDPRAHDSHASLLGEERSASKSSFAGFGEEPSGDSSNFPLPWHWLP